MSENGPFAGQVVSVQGTTPGPDPTYTVDVNLPAGVRRFPLVRPQTWRWDQFGVDEDGAKMVGKWIACFLVGNRLAADFVPPPLVGPCTGPESALLPALLDRLGQLELRLAKLEAAP